MDPHRDPDPYVRAHISNRYGHGGKFPLQSACLKAAEEALLTDLLDRPL